VDLKVDLVVNEEVAVVEEAAAEEEVVEAVAVEEEPVAVETKSLRAGNQ